jgi:hypothetical protein
MVTGADSLRLLIGGAIAALSGFLFAITYRYIIEKTRIHTSKMVLC